MSIQDTFNALRQPIGIEQACYTCKYQDEGIRGTKARCNNCVKIPSDEDLTHPDHVWEWNGVSQPGEDE